MPDVSYPGVYIEELPAGVHPIPGVPTATTAFVGSAAGGPKDEPTPVHSFTEFERVFGEASTDEALGLAIRHFFLNGGKDAIAVRAAGPAVPPDDDGAGIYALGADDGFNLLCLPDLGSGASSGELGAIAAQLAVASQLCDARRALLIVDPLPWWRSVADLASDQTGVETVASRMRGANAALYFPRLAAARGGAGAMTGLPPSGAIAGIIARTDLTRGIWKAPSGQAASIDGIEGLSVTLSEDATRSLTALGVNALRVFPSTGPVVWGARTLAGAVQASDTDWKYIPVRRLALFIEESLDRGLDWVVFEPNDEPLWASIRTSVGAFMTALFRQAAFQGTTPREAYFVKCGGDTTTQEEIDAGIVNVVVGFAPLRPSEFVVIEIAVSTRDD